MAKQLVYLHNTVLLPKVAYRSQIFNISISECNVITRPFRIIFKQKCKLTKGVPNDILYMKEFYGVIDLFDHLRTQNITTLMNCLNSDTILRDIFDIRLLLLQNLM